MAQPEEIAAWVWALASRSGVGFMTGETLRVAGGQHSSWAGGDGSAQARRGSGPAGWQARRG